MENLFFSSLPKEVVSLFSSGLTALDEEGEVVPALAGKWEKNSRGDEFTFFLRSNLFWKDGKKLVSSDLQFDFPNVSVSYPSSEKITFHLKNPLASFPALLSRPVFRKNSFIGTGPCEVKKVKQEKGKIERIWAYCSPWNLNLDIRFYSTEEDGLVALNLGEIKILFGLENFPQTFPGFKILEKENYSRFVAVFYNLSDPALSQKVVRQALSFAIPKNPAWKRTLGPISPKSWAYNPYLREYNFSLKKAKKLLEGQSLPSFLVLKTTSFYYPLALKIKENWEKLGISVEVEKVNLDQIFAKNFQTILIAQEIPPDPDQYTLWHSTQETNITHLKNPKIDKLLEDGRRVFDKEKRKEIYQDFQKYLVEECPAAFLYYPVEYVLVSKKLDTPLFYKVFPFLRSQQDSNLQPTP